MMTAGNSVAGDLADHVCGACMHCEQDRRVLEATIPGLISFSSGYGASVGDTRLCLRRDQLVSPHDSCGEFRAVP
ncbi:hypothetical protein [Caballeronia sp.]|uniref:hypothetical protein n=1 Tax=Caballeronia sp. TaxID=1931223 RepID=UPI003C3A4F80